MIQACCCLHCVSDIISPKQIKWQKLQKVEGIHSMLK